jgi:hyperosmotically inducible protein
MKTSPEGFRRGVAAVLFSAGLLLCGCESRQAGAAAVQKLSLGTGIDDGVITTKVKTALLADPDVKSFDLKVETRNGEVMLSGFVVNASQVERALNVTRAVEGVKWVTDKMSLKEGTTTVGNKVDDGIITARIKSILFADPGIRSLDIAVATQKGVGQLSGFVNDQSQIDHATALARSVQGVTSVASEMVIKN